MVLPSEGISYGTFEPISNRLISRVFPLEKCGVVLVVQYTAGIFTVVLMGGSHNSSVSIYVLYSEGERNGDEGARFHLTNGRYVAHDWPCIEVLGVGMLAKPWLTSACRR